MRVLIVDDSEVVRQRLSSLISEINGIVEIEEAGDGVAALEAIERMEPDAIILDISMPKMNGFQALVQIRKKQHRPVVIMLTNYAYEPFQEHCLNAGADYFFDKSTEFLQIIDVLTQLQNESERKVS